jgi:hypothetical protein
VDGAPSAANSRIAEVDGIRIRNEKPRCCREDAKGDRFVAERNVRKTKSPLTQRAFVKLCHQKKSGAGEGIRTLDPDLGKVVLYH